MEKIEFKGIDTMQLASHVAEHANGSSHTRMQKADMVVPHSFFIQSLLITLIH